jgi:hypothetical protein
MAFQDPCCEVKEIKKILAETLKRINLVNDTYTGEVTLGLTDGGVTYIRKSETLK